MWNLGSHARTLWLEGRVWRQTSAFLTSPQVALRQLLCRRHGENNLARAAARPLPGVPQGTGPKCWCSRGLQTAPGLQRGLGKLETSEKPNF